MEGQRLGDCWLTVKQAAEYMAVDYRTVLDWVYRSVRPIPHKLPLGNKKQVRIKKSELDKWIEENWL